MSRLRSRRQPPAIEIANTDLMPDDEDAVLQAPSDYLDEHHPENDQYMKSVEHIQRQIMYVNKQLRPKQVQILKTVFSGVNYTNTAKEHGTTLPTVSRLVKSTNGERLLSLLHYHLKLIEGPNEAQRRSMLWRIAAREEVNNPKTSIAALGELNKMHNFAKQLDQTAELANSSSSATPTVIVNINQATLPRGNLD